MDAPRYVLVVGSSTKCAEELRRHAFHVLESSDPDAAFHSATTVDAVVLHMDASDDVDPKTSLVRRLQTSVTTRHIPIVIAITGRPNRPDTVTVQRFGGALIVLTNARCEGVAAVLDDLLNVERHRT